MLALLLLGCGPDPAPADTGPACEHDIRETFPARESTSAIAHHPLEVHLSEPHPDEVGVSLDGSAVSHTWNADRTKVTVDTEGLLAPVTAYEVAFDYCRGVAEWTFETSELGLPLEDELGPSSWLIDLTKARVTLPDGLGVVIAPYGCLLGVELGESSVGAVPGQVGQILDSDTWDPCVAWPDAGGALFSSEESLLPRVATGQHEVRLSGPGDTCIAAHEAWTLALVLTPDQAGLEADLVGRADVREFSVYWGENPDSHCDNLADYGMSCVPCTDGEVACVDVAWQGAWAEPASALDWPEPTTQDDCHAECSASACNPDCNLYLPNPTDLEEGHQLSHSLAGTWSSPASIAPALVSALDEAAIALTFGTPDLCAGTLDLTWSWPESDGRGEYGFGMKSLDPEDLTFETRSKDWTLPIAGEERGFFDATWSGRLQSNSTTVSGLTLTGLLDVGDLVLDGAQACVEAETAGDECTACPDDGVHGCLAVEVLFPSQEASPP